MAHIDCDGHKGVGRREGGEGGAVAWEGGSALWQH